MMYYKILTMILLVIALFISGCMKASYKYLKPDIYNASLDPSKPVIISTPDDGMYGAKTYKNSGKATANEIKRIISRYAKGKVIVIDCINSACLTEEQKATYTYYFNAEISHWEDRATEWNYRPDRLSLKLSVYDIKTGDLIAETDFSSRSRTLFATRNSAFDLIKTPIDRFIKTLYAQ